MGVDPAPTLTVLAPAGQYCTEDVDECQLMPNACQNGGTCHNTHGGYNCVCVNGWTGEDCSENIDDCASAACFHGATCHDRVASFYCECPHGRTGERQARGGRAAPGGGEHGVTTGLALPRAPSSGHTVTQMRRGQLLEPRTWPARGLSGGKRAGGTPGQAHW